MAEPVWLFTSVWGGSGGRVLAFEGGGGVQVTAGPYPAAVVGLADGYLYSIKQP